MNVSSLPHVLHESTQLQKTLTNVATAQLEQRDNSPEKTAVTIEG